MSNKLIVDVWTFFYSLGWACEWLPYGSMGGKLETDPPTRMLMHLVPAVWGIKTLQNIGLLHLYSGLSAMPWLLSYWRSCGEKSYWRSCGKKSYWRSCGENLLTCGLLHPWNMVYLYGIYNAACSFRLGLLGPSKFSCLHCPCNRAPCAAARLCFSAVVGQCCCKQWNTVSAWF